MSDLTEDQRERLESTLPPGSRGYIYALAPVVAKMLTEQREQIAREIEGWGVGAAQDSPIGTRLSVGTAYDIAARIARGGSDD